MHSKFSLGSDETDGVFSYEKFLNVVTCLRLMTTLRSTRSTSLYFRIGLAEKRQQWLIILVKKPSDANPAFLVRVLALQFLTP